MSKKKFIRSTVNLLRKLKDEIPKVEEFYEGAILKTSVLEVQKTYSDEESDLVLWYRECIYELYDILHCFMDNDKEFIKMLSEVLEDLKTMLNSKIYKYYMVPSNKNKLSKIYYLLKKMYCKTKSKVWKKWYRSELKKMVK